MSRNVKKYFEFSAGHSLSDSSDEEEFFVSSKIRKTKNASDAINSKNGLPANLSKKKKNGKRFYEPSSTESTPKELETFKEMTRKNIDSCSAKLKVLVLRQISELDDAKKKYMDSLIDELNRWKKYNDHLEYEEGKLLEVFQKLKDKYYLMKIENNKFKRIREVHESFIKEHGEIMKKYEAETDALKNNTVKEISDIKRNLFQKYKVEK